MPFHVRDYKKCTHKNRHGPNRREISFGISWFRKSRKSLPLTMISDNAFTYVASAETLKQLFESSSLKEAFSRQGVEWRFIPKRAPCYGGFWERLIGLTKSTLKKTLGRASVTPEELQTLIVEVEAILNDRPITFVSSEINDEEP